MSLFAISGLFTFMANLIFSAFVFWKSKGEKLRVILGFFCLFAAIWGLGVYKFSTAKLPEVALYGWQIADTGAIFTYVFYAHFVFLYLKLERRFLLLAAYSLGVGFLFMDWFLPKYFFGKLSYLFGQFYSVDLLKQGSEGYWIFYLLFGWGLLGYSFITLIAHYRRSSGIKREQLGYFIFGSLVGWFGANSNFLFKMHIPTYSYANFFVAIYPSIWVYAIFRYRLLDIRIAITRVGIFFFVYFLVLGFPFWLWQQTHNGYLAIGIMFVLATIGPLIFNYLKAKAEEILENKIKTYQEKLADLAKTEQERRQRYIDHFSASLAHEIVNPVFGISGMAQMFKVWVEDDVKKKLSPEELNYVNENIDRISRDADRVLKLVKTVREFSSPNSGEMTLIELDKVIEAFRIIVEPQFKYNGVDSSFELTPGIKLQANKVYLEEVLMSLASNAIDAVSQNQGDKVFKMKVSSASGVCRIEIQR